MNEITRKPSRPIVGGAKRRECPTGRPPDGTARRSTSWRSAKGPSDFRPTELFTEALMNLHHPSASNFTWTPSVQSGGPFSTDGPVPHLPPPCEPQADVVARLEWLDDLMFAAVDGDPTALELAADAWRRALDDLGADTVEESRRQYLRHAQATWDRLRKSPDQPPHKVFAAIEVISILSGRAW